MTIGSFIPPQRTLMGPGPSDIYPQVLQALSRPTIGHLDPLFIGMMDELKQLLQYAFQTQNPFTIAVSAPGSAGMEACFVNLVEPGDTVIVCRNGVFGDRMRENVERCGGIAVMVDNAWGEPVDPALVAEALTAHPEASIVAFVHAETSTGALSDAEAIAKLARQHDCLTIVDAVTSLGGVPLLVDEWQLDAVYSGSQKCLSCVPGLSPLTFSARAIEKIQARKTPAQSWFLDQSLVLGYWSGEGKRSYHHTAPVNSLYALHEALVLLKNEGLEQAWQRHRDMHQTLRAGLEALGITFVVDEAHRLPQLNAVYIPEGVDDAAIRARLLNDYNLEIGAGLGALAGKAWRIGLMGYAARRENVALCLRALETCLK
ncbi:pyridoxal-phosphate-dependent aminotransferase family protein [Photobacterium aphoticum]|uniref:Alanine--glyoxylate aminotransferase n=1 Tax=Photobacterium aphoticum TaxID=754436 RepID=A0A0J1GSW2_9GAMM|nr:alanine--glyoxylate aminotransferase family protein [Photobacterium aphoticum]KLV02736.1 alanine--glyoxylate aminotransferase [Photobacterium aphoticum]PSU54723.1 alanine--glyoxylate aminotransferase family protein [Photobacterium aphoticum]GHA54694.1 alanine--glyoxylate aminotransferase [Photobacterium aphoticum]